jgi:hypothetical protein
MGPVVCPLSESICRSARIGAHEMAKLNSNPESVSDLRHEVRGLNQNFKKLQESIVASQNKSPGWQRIRKHPLIATVIGGVIVLAIGGAYSRVESAFVNQMNASQDARVKAQTDPILTRLSLIDERLSRTEGALSVLRAEAAAAKYVRAPEKELKAHHDELRDIKDRLAQSKPDVPGYWPATFQIITLFSRATFDVEKIAAGPESSLDNVASNPPGVLLSPIQNRRVVLKNLVQGMIFKNSIIRFDPTVRLVNDVFIDCVFIFPSTGETPPAPLQRIGETLLASDLSEVTLNAS